MRFGKAIPLLSTQPRAGRFHPRREQPLAVSAADCEFLSVCEPCAQGQESHTAASDEAYPLSMSTEPIVRGRAIIAAQAALVFKLYFCGSEAVSSEFRISEPSRSQVQHLSLRILSVTPDGNSPGGDYVYPLVRKCSQIV